MAMIAITLVFDDDERGVGESSGLDTDASSLATGATVRDEPKN